ncbi:MAG: lysophospholipid acyltransferase family protein [bacterium]|nr:lysophospholipid acyltransferase family protein [bacterium]
MVTLRGRIELGFVKVLESLFRSVSLKRARSIGAGIGALLDLIGIRKTVMLENLRYAYPDAPDSDLQKIASGVYRSFGKTLAEFARLPILNSQNVLELIEWHGFEQVQEALKLGKGIIGVSGHIGNWEWMGAGTSLRGVPMTYVVTTQNNSFIEKRMDELRGNCGIEIVKRKDAAKGVLRALRSNRMVAILCDQDAHKEGVFVPFFGRLASTPRGAMVFALRTDSPVFFTEGVREGERFIVTFEQMDLSNLPTELDAAVEEGMKRITARLEASVRRHPEQWLWLHRRWKTNKENS